VARYRKIDTRIWNDEKFRELSDDAKLVFFFLLTHPHMTSIGAVRATLPGLAAEIKWTSESLQRAFAEASSRGMAKHDAEASVIWLPNFIRYNAPENPNVLKAWASAVELLPECDLTREAVQAVKDFSKELPESFQKELPEVFANTGTVTGAGTGTDKATAPLESGSGPLIPGHEPKGKISSGMVSMKTFFERCKAAGEKYIPETDPVFTYADKAGIPHEFVALAWRVFRENYQDTTKKYIDWRKAFRKCVEKGGYGLWTIDKTNGLYVLTGVGLQAERAHKRPPELVAP
jgi:hypothetical protein